MCPRFGRRILARSIVFECLPPSFEGGTYANWHTFLGALCAAFVDQRHRKIKQLSEKQLFATKDCDCLTALHCAAFRGHVAFCEKHLGPCKLEILPVFFPTWRFMWDHSTAPRIVQHGSFAEVCKTDVLDLVTLRNARDEPWLSNFPDHSGC